MKKHYNLYYLFLEDKTNHPMPEKRRWEIREVITLFYQSFRLPEKTKRKIKNFSKP